VVDKFDCTVTLICQHGPFLRHKVDCTVVVFADLVRRHERINHKNVDFAAPDLPRQIVKSEFSDLRAVAGLHRRAKRPFAPTVDMQTVAKIAARNTVKLHRRCNPAFEFVAGIFKVEQPNRLSPAVDGIAQQIAARDHRQPFDNRQGRLAKPSGRNRDRCLPPQ
jgi:hypothetical protein